MALRVDRELHQGEGGDLGSADGEGGASVDVDLESGPRADAGPEQLAGLLGLRRDRLQE